MPGISRDRDPKVFSPKISWDLKSSRLGFVRETMLDYQWERISVTDLFLGWYFPRKIHLCRALLVAYSVSLYLTDYPILRITDRSINTSVEAV